MRSLREEKGVSQTDMAKYLKISRQAYNYYELNKREPSYDTLKALAEYFNVTTDYLLGLSNSKSSHAELSEIDALSDESKKELEKYIQLLKIKDELDKGKEEQSAALEKDA